MAQLVAPTQEEIDLWNIVELGVRDGSSPTVNFDVGGSTASRELLCNWTDRYKVARWLVGAVATYNDSGDLKLSRLNPQQLPNPDPDEETPLWPTFHATKITEITGHQWSDFDIADEDAPPPNPDSSIPYRFSPSTVNRFTCAKLKVQYERCPMEFAEDGDTSATGPFGEITRNVQFVPEEGEVRYLTIPPATQKYISPTGSGTGHNTAVPYPAGLTESIYRFRLRWHRIPYEAWEIGSSLRTRVFGDGTVANLPYLNAINSVNFYGYPPGTVMLEKVTEKLDPSLLDQSTWPWTWTLDYQFAVKMMGWNFAWFFPNLNEFTGAGNAAVRMFVGRGTTYYAPGSETLPPLYSQYPEYDLHDLFNIDDGA